MIKNGDFIETLLKDGHIKGAKFENINAASLNLTLSNVFKTFDYNDGTNISLKNPHNQKYIIHEGKYLLKPQGFVLASSVEVCDLPNNIAVKLTMRSSAGRLGLDHLNCGLIEPEFEGNITFEFVSKHPIFKEDGKANRKCIILNEGDVVIQAVFYDIEPVKRQYSYKLNGNYMNQKGTTTSLGI